METQSGSQNGSITSGTPWVIVAEDDKSFRDFVTEALEWSDFDITAFPSGSEVLEFLELKRDASRFPDLVLTDVRMPSCDGLSLLKTTRERFPDLPVILMTSYGDHEVLKEALQHGCHGYIDKPFVVSQLEAVVSKTLADHARLKSSIQERTGSGRLVKQDPENLQRIGKYEVLCEVARGAMGIIYKARQVDLDRLVALKVHRSGGEGGAEDFRREAQAMARLRHPHIAVVHEINSEDGIEYFTMDYVEGEIVARRMRRGPIAHSEAVELLAPIAEGLAHAHELGIFHRDVKPANIVLGEGDRGPILVDFGIATRKDDAPDEEYLEGTLHYMAPEYAGGATYDELCDQFSFGVVLYETLAGRGKLPWWENPIPIDLLHGGPRALSEFLTATKPIGIGERTGDIPDALAEVIARSIAIAPDDRYPGMSALAQALRACTDR